MTYLVRLILSVTATVCIGFAQHQAVVATHLKLPRGAVLKHADPAKAPSRHLTYVVPGKPSDSIRFFEAEGFKNQLKKNSTRGIFKTSEGTLVVSMSSCDFGSKGRVSGAMPPKGKHFIEIIENPRVVRQRVANPK